MKETEMFFLLCIQGWPYIISSIPLFANWRNAIGESPLPCKKKLFLLYLIPYWILANAVSPIGEKRNWRNYISP